MQVFTGIEKAKNRIRKAVVTTGSFDGVHIGHHKILENLNGIAESIGGESVLITFDPHPRKLLYPEQSDFKLLSSRSEKIELLKNTGIHNLIIHPFTIEFSKISSYDFIEKYIIKYLQAEVIVVGKNHNFGHNREGDYNYLYELSQKLNFGVKEISLKDIEKETVSSMKIRKALFSGNIEHANHYLGYEYFLSGMLINLDDNSQFALQIDEEDKLIPAAGNYEVKVFVNNKILKAQAIIVNKNSNDAEVKLLISCSQNKLDKRVAKVIFTKRH